MDGSLVSAAIAAISALSPDYARQYDGHYERHYDWKYDRQWCGSGSNTRSTSAPNPKSTQNSANRCGVRAF
ncbi:MAG: hypothetical protein SLagBPW_20480 [Shewanella algae]